MSKPSQPLLSKYQIYKLYISVSLLSFPNLCLLNTYSGSYFFCLDVRNLLYSHHPSQHSHLSSFHSILFSLCQCSGWTLQHQNLSQTLILDTHVRSLGRLLWCVIKNYLQQSDSHLARCLSVCFQSVHEKQHWSYLFKLGLIFFFNIVLMLSVLYNIIFFIILFFIFCLPIFVIMCFIIIIIY